MLSICIPTYNQPQLLERCLTSISVQTYRNFEIIITDDSNTDDVKHVVGQWLGSLPITYEKHVSPKGSPANWNAALGRAKGDLIYLLHQDDWLSTTNSLQQMVSALDKWPDARFVYCHYYAKAAYDAQAYRISTAGLSVEEINAKPTLLLFSNEIGPPSNVIFRKGNEQYDESFKWLVDIDFYIRLLKTGDGLLLPEHLVTIGVHDEQITNACLEDKDIQLRENIMLLHKVGDTALRDIRVYDFFWRLLRNTGVRKAGDLNRLIPQSAIPAAVLRMMQSQSGIRASYLQVGVISKIAMLYNYWRFRMA